MHMEEEEEEVGGVWWEPKRSQRGGADHTGGDVGGTGRRGEIMHFCFQKGRIKTYHTFPLLLAVPLYKKNKIKGKDYSHFHC